MIRVLNELMKNEVYGSLEDFKQTYYCGTGVAQDLQLNEIPDFTFYDNGQECNIYDGRKLIYSCNYIEYCGVKHITTVYNSKGLFTEFMFDYDSVRSRCLYDIWMLKQAEPERWIYRLEPVYEKYGTDVVNAVRGNAHLFCI